MMTRISPPWYLLDQARRRLSPPLGNLPGMGATEKWMLNHEWKQVLLAEPPAGSGLKPIVGNAGMPGLGHVIEIFRSGPDYALRQYHRHGPLLYDANPVCPAVLAFGPEAVEAILANRGKDFSQQGWVSILGSFFDRGLLLLDFDEHMSHRRIIQQVFVRPKLARYVEDIDRVATEVIADWVADDPRFLVYPATNRLALKVGAVVFMGRDPESGNELSKVDWACGALSRAPGAILRAPVPPFRWWTAMRARKLLEEYFAAEVAKRRDADGTDVLTLLCHAEDEDGNRFTDTDIVNHMIFLMFTSEPPATTITSIVYWLAAHPDWQDRVRDESMPLGDNALDIEDLERLELLDRVMNESLRLDTPLMVHMRRAVRDTELLGHYLPAGTDVACWPSMNHRLPELWTDPEKFDPDRFAEPRAEHKKHRYAFAPFGGGAHKCIGMTFGQLEIKIVVHRLLRRYRLELPHRDYRPRWDYSSLVPSDGMPIVLRPLTR
ncbi:MAG: cytochrome P450 [Mycobacterium sp.]